MVNYIHIVFLVFTKIQGLNNRLIIVTITIYIQQHWQQISIRISNKIYKIIKKLFKLLKLIKKINRTDIKVNYKNINKTIKYTIILHFKTFKMASKTLFIQTKNLKLKKNERKFI